MDSKEENARIGIADMAFNVLTNTPRHKTVEGITIKQKRELGKFSFQEYELMSENPRVKNMIARSLDNMDVKKLTEVVTIAKGYKKQTSKDKRLANALPIQLVIPAFLKDSPARARPATARPATSQLRIDRLPLEVLDKIKGDLKYLLDYDLYEWVPVDKLDNFSLSTNYKAINYLKKNRTRINYRGLSANTNPKAIELLRAQIEKEDDEEMREIREMREMREIREMREMREKSQGSQGSQGSRSSRSSRGSRSSRSSRSSQGSQGSQGSIDRIDWTALSKNPNAIKLLKAQILKEKTPGVTKRINWVAFCCNPHPETIGILKKKMKEDMANIELYRPELYIHWSSLSRNTSNEAIAFLKKNRDNIDWWVLSGNTNPEAIKLLKAFIFENPENPNIAAANEDNLLRVDWYSICRNENAMDIIKVVKTDADLMKWGAFMSNTNLEAIKIIDQKIKEDPSKIFWAELSRNPSAIAILLANPGNIHWYTFSVNTNNTMPGAMELLMEKMKVDVNGNILDWDKLSANTSIFKVRLG